MSRFPVLDPAAVRSRPEAIDVSTQASLKAAWVAKMAELLPTYDVAMLRSDPGGITADALSFLRVLDRKHINDVYRAGLLAFATKNDLTALAANYGLGRFVYSPATATAAEVDEADGDLQLRCWLEPQRWARGSSNLGLEGAAWSLAQPDASDIRVYDYPGQGRMRCVLLPRPGLDAAGQAALLARVSQGLMRRDTRPGSIQVDIVLAEVLDLDLVITLGVQPGASPAAARAAGAAAVAAYLDDTRIIGERVALSRIEGDACATNVAYAHVAGMTGDLVPGPGQAYQAGNIQVVTERARG